MSTRERSSVTALRSRPSNQNAAKRNSIDTILSNRLGSFYRRRRRISIRRSLNVLTLWCTNRSSYLDASRQYSLRVQLTQSVGRSASRALISDGRACWTSSVYSSAAEAAKLHQSATDRARYAGVSVWSVNASADRCCCCCRRCGRNRRRWVRAVTPRIRNWRRSQNDESGEREMNGARERACASEPVTRTRCSALVHRRVHMHNAASAGSAVDARYFYCLGLPFAAHTSSLYSHSNCPRPITVRH